MGNENEAPIDITSEHCLRATPCRFCIERRERRRRARVAAGEKQMPDPWETKINPIRDIMGYWPGRPFEDGAQRAGVLHLKEPRPEGQLLRRKIKLWGRKAR